ncbi:MAG: 2-oxoacid:acceptor oxidoreductase subunit alpha [Bacteroidota bacterium]|nr:2-oxoacid:acceptor oxidoreductase subunit alpha [Bacteroidota bacterium]
MLKNIEALDQVVIRFAGDSGDGIQLIGSEFSMATALARNDLGTFPDFPAEIRAPAGTLPGVSGFQIHFGSVDIHTPGDSCNVLVVMNAAALKKNIDGLSKGGIILANEDGFDIKNLKLANYPSGVNPLDDLRNNKDYQLHIIPITKLTRVALSTYGLGTKETDRSKNMFILGLICWMYNRPMLSIHEFLQRKFGKHPVIFQANIDVLNAGYAYGETTELMAERYTIKPAKMPAGKYRSITGNAATALGMLAASVKSGLQLFFGTYPITPASDILHDLAKFKSSGVITFQAEDEIAAVCSAIGASYAGLIGATASSGPGLDLKSESIGLAVMLEQPLVVINVQRAGPSTGMPTKTEQADLLQSFHGRHGEAPLPIIAANSPSDCFNTAFEATKIAIEYMTPVIMLSDGYIANGTEPWLFPSELELAEINAPFAKVIDGGKFHPYQRDENLVRKWAIPGVKELENRIGGLEKEDVTGNISYDAKNHELMVHIRNNKVKNIANNLPPVRLDSGLDSGDLLVISWGGTYGSVKTACLQLQAEGLAVSHLHLRWLNPMPKGIPELASKFKHIVVPELNTGQLKSILRSEYLIPAIGFNKIQGQPFTIQELKDSFKTQINN